MPVTRWYMGVVRMLDRGQRRCGKGFTTETWERLANWPSASAMSACRHARPTPSEITRKARRSAGPASASALVVPVVFAVGRRLYGRNRTGPSSESNDQATTSRNVPSRPSTCNSSSADFRQSAMEGETSIRTASSSQRSWLERNRMTRAPASALSSAVRSSSSSTERGTEQYCFSGRMARKSRPGFAAYCRRPPRRKRPRALHRSVGSDRRPFPALHNPVPRGRPSRRPGDRRGRRLGWHLLIRCCRRLRLRSDVRWPPVSTSHGFGHGSGRSRRCRRLGPVRGQPDGLGQLEAVDVEPGELVAGPELVPLRLSRQDRGRHLVSCLVKRAGNPLSRVPA